MKLKEPERKVCRRCGRIWESFTPRPVRCPGCGTYHWDSAPVTNECVMCGHRWFSRTSQVPIRCPHCKTRSWKGEVMVHRVFEKPPDPSFEANDVAERYDSGQGCVEISMATGLSLGRVISIVRYECDCADGVRMRV